MVDYIPTTMEDSDQSETGVKAAGSKLQQVGRPSNEVYARVGDTVLRAARDGVRGGMRPEDIIREIVAEHHVRLNLGEFRLLLASRRIQERRTGDRVSPVEATPVTP